MAVLTIANVFAQQKKEVAFQLSSEAVKVYDYESSTKGVSYEYQFEDDYTIKLTNKAYKINLFFEKDEIEAVQKAVSKVFDGSTTSSGFKTMVWKKTSQEGKPSYQVELKDNKLRIEVMRKHMDDEAYRTLNHLGEEFIRVINS